MLDLFLLLFTVHHSALAPANIHSFHELLFAIHALELHKDISATWLVMLFIRSTFLHNLPSFYLQFCDLGIDFLDLLLILFRLTILLAQHLFLLVIFFLLKKHLTDLFHKFQVAKAGQSKINIPNIVLMIVYLTSIRILQHVWLLGVDILDPCVVDSRQVLERLFVRLLVNGDREVHWLNAIAIDLLLDLILHFFESQH